MSHGLRHDPTKSRGNIGEKTRRRWEMRDVCWMTVQSQNQHNKLRCLVVYVEKFMRQEEYVANITTEPPIGLCYEVKRSVKK